MHWIASEARPLRRQELKGEKVGPVETLTSVL